MTHRTISFAAGAWMVLAVMTAAALAVTGVQDLLGRGQFAYWHLMTLFISVFMLLENLTEADLALLAALLRLLRMKAAASFLKIRRKLRLWAARGLAALLPSHSQKQVYGTE